MATSLHVERRGSGTPVLFVHSFGGDSSHWSAAMTHLEQEHRVVAFDLRAHGRSPGTPGKYSIAALANDIDTVASREQLTAFILVGHSLGALAAAEYAGSNSARVKALVLVDPPAAPGAIPPDQLQQVRDELDRDPYPVVERFWEQQMFAGSRAETISKLLAALRALPREAAAALTDASLDYDAIPALLRYPGPKFAIVTPANDAASSLHNMVPGFRHAVIDGTGHWIHLDKPVEFNEALDEFLPGIATEFDSIAAISGMPRYPPPVAP